MWSTRKTTVISARSPWTAALRKRGQPRDSKRSRASRPRTATALRSTRLTAPAPRVGYQSNRLDIRGASGRSGQIGPEGRAAPGGVGDADAPAVRGHDRGGDAQAQPTAALVPAAQRVRAMEALEDPIAPCCGNSR